MEKLLGRWRRDDAAFTGAEKALLVCFALAIVTIVGASVRGGTSRAGGDARRVLEQGMGPSGAVAFPRGLDFNGSPRAMDEGGEEAPATTASAAAALAVATVAGAATPAQPVEAAAAEPALRQQALQGYRSFLEARIAELEALEGQAKVDRAEGLLEQIETVSDGFRNDRYPDLTTLTHTPTGSTQAALSTYVPPELVTPTRRIIATLERPITGVVLTDGAQLEASRYALARDWNARLGVPQYRTQSDNLAAPEATCNVTSLSMVLERLGYNRQDVVDAVERELKIRQIRAQGRDPAREDLSQVALADGAWERAVRSYLNTNNADTANYRRLRGGATTDAQRAALARSYRGAAQMEDMLDFLLSLKGISRYEAAIQGPAIFRSIEPTEASRPTAELVSPSARLNWQGARAQIQRALDDGGAAMLSIYHKGAGQDGTHLITIQRLTPTGAIVDDPYGRIRSNYNRNQVGDAYADPGRTRGDSAYRNVKHTNDSDRDGFDDDWRVPQAQSPTGDETRGDGYEISNEVIARMWNRVTIYRRPAAVAAAPAGTAPAGN